MATAATRTVAGMMRVPTAGTAYLRCRWSQMPMATLSLAKPLTGISLTTRCVLCASRALSMQVRPVHAFSSQLKLHGRCSE